jgi:putative aminopeptidase FrvX
MVQEIKKRGKGKYPRGGWKPKSAEERKVQIFGSVKKKYYQEAEQAVKELLKQWR